MNFKATRDRRSVLLSLQFEKSVATQSESLSSETPRIACISALYADHDDISVKIYDDHDEATLLRRFWLSLRANDQIYAADVAERFALLRQRSWLLDLIPAPQIDLRCVYSVELWDIGQMWTSGYIPNCLHIDDQRDSPIALEAPIDGVSDFEVVVHSRN